MRQLSGKIRRAGRERARETGRDVDQVWLCDERGVWKRKAGKGEPWRSEGGFADGWKDGRGRGREGGGGGADGMGRGRV